MDRAYVDFSWLFVLDSSEVIFVTRLKSNAKIRIAESYLTNEKHEHILSDEDIELTGFYSSKEYPKTLRIVKVYDEKNDNYLVLLTNQMSWTANTISQIYKARWDIEVFFKHINATLKNKKLYRRVRKCSKNSNVDCINGNFDIVVSKTKGKIQMASIKFGWVLKNQFICQNRSI